MENHVKNNYRQKKYLKCVKQQLKHLKRSIESS